MTASHHEKETLAVDVIIPAHADRVTTALFRETREKLLQRDGGRCWICDRTAAESGHPLEAHHVVIERCVTEMVDWPRFIAQAKRGDYGYYVQTFDWDSFDPAKPYDFVDDMTANGRVLCKSHHVGKNEGIHNLPGPLWLPQRFAKDGYKFSDVEVIHYGT